MIRNSRSDSSLAQRRGRLVHDEDARRRHPRPRAKVEAILTMHPVADRQPPEIVRARCRRRRARRARRGRDLQRPPVDEAAETRRIGAAEEQVLGDAEPRQRRSVPDAGTGDRADARRARSRSRPAAPSRRIVAAVGRHDAGEDLDQRALAGAVLAHQRVDFAGLERERRVPQRGRAAIGFAQRPASDSRLMPRQVRETLRRRRRSSSFTLAAVISFVGT